MPSSTEPPRKQPPRSTQCADVGAQRDLEALGLHEVELQRAQRRVERAVEDHPPDALREQVGVRRAEEGAVGGAEVGQLVVAEHRPQHVHVLGRLDGRHVLGQVAALVDAALAELVQQLVGPATSASVSGSGSVATKVSISRVGEAVERGAAADTAGVEADDVEGLLELGAEVGRGVGGVVDAGTARPTGVHHQGADALARVAGRHLEHRQRDRLAVRLGVVERHLELGALVVAAAGPVELLVVEPGQVGLRLLLGRRPARPGWPRATARAAPGRVAVEEAAPGQGQRQGERDRQEAGCDAGHGPT